MMFEKKPLALIIMAILTSTLTLTGCNEGDDGDKGDKGDTGTAGAAGVAGPQGATGTKGDDGSAYFAGNLKRFMTAPLGAEFTGMFVNTDGTFFANIQHPNSSNTTADTAGKVFSKAAIGYVNGVNVNSLGSVSSLDLPITQADKELVKTAAGQYVVVAQNGDAMTDGNKVGDILDTTGTTLITNSSDPDFNGVVSDGGTGYYLYSNWEDRPGSMSRIHLSSSYSPTLEGMLDFSAVKGTWVNCFGTVSPWGTPLTSEELYFDNTSDWFDKSAQFFSNPQAMAKYQGFPTDGSGNWPNPYDVGYIVEIGTNGTVATANEANVQVNKLELLGRFSHENSVVMPDRRTVFLSDDGGNTVLFKFVADTAGNLSSGTLYAAKVTQAASVVNAAEAAFSVTWVRLGSGTESVIEAAIRSFDGTFAQAKYITNAQVTAFAAGNNPYSDDRIAFLESRKTAAAKGATAEWNKMEGININFNLASTWWNNGAADGSQAYMYMAMSDVTGGMSDGKGDIAVEANRCGVVYRMKLVKNSNGLVDIKSIVPAIAGGPYNSSNANNRCSVNSIASPDNLVILNDGRVLIGEDTGHHENNMVWVFKDPAI